MKNRVGRELRRQTGRLFVVGVGGGDLTAEEAAILRSVQPGGVILFGRNVLDGAQLLRLVAAIRSAAPAAILMADAEGGRVDRLRAVVGPAPAAQDLASRRPAVAGQAGFWVGAALRHFGFDLDLAPVVDLDRGGRDNALDRRLFGRDVRSVTARAAAFLAGLEAAGVGGCIKHFPGLGGALFDTHHRMARIDLPRRALRRDLEPFRRLSARAGMVLLSHALYPAWDGGGRPATLSPAIATDLLRRDLGFRGLSISDDLEMKALEAWGDLGERSLAAFAAGCDLLPICSRLTETPAAIDRVAGALLGSAVLARRAGAARRRLDLWRERAARRAKRTPPLPLEAVVENLRRLNEARPALA